MECASNTNVQSKATRSRDVRKSEREVLAPTPKGTSAITLFTRTLPEISAGAMILHMFCPECGAEYRPGFTHCTDCDVDLVAELPRPEPETNLTDLKHVWTGKEQDRCVELCKDFGAKGVPYKVEQSRHQYLKTVDEKYRISVPKEFFETAVRIIKRGS